ncbi:hypothetical protein HK097_005832 [Rhizophlyctis rosea]|uniref:STAS domain-containing protein n=1 Tax=Rhizophlyctis rosea TaxID=64517 RepID=A0AAD5X318_9FUNG|nr:hypothetical protein HK097_005832 [Rhizophlyctis rosea]
MSKTEIGEFRENAREFFAHFPTHAKNYLLELVPIAGWLPRYNRDWLYGDFIAGLTIGIVVIPQAIAYATLAGAPVQNGLFTMFFGMVLYAWFATSKDVTVGATAVLSLVIGQTAGAYNGDKHIDNMTFLSGMALLGGIVQLLLGLLRLGVIVDFIPSAVISGFCSGSGIVVIFQQFPGILGTPNINTNDAAYLVIINTFKNIKNTVWLNAAFGIPTLIFVVSLKLGTDFLQRRGHKWAKWVGISRNAIALVLFTLISFGVNRGLAKPIIKIVGNVPVGFAKPQTPDINSGNIGQIASAAAGVTIVAILEHIAVVKSYGRLNGYVAKADQELTALGIINIVSSFFGGFTATASFSRSAIKSQSGVRTPGAGFLVGAIIVIALYAINAAYYYIPSASISAIIAAAIAELVSPLSVPKQLFDIKIIDAFIFFLAAFITIFVNIEYAIYASVALALAVFLLRVARPHNYALVRSQASGTWVPPTTAAKDASIVPTPAGVVVYKIVSSFSYPNAGYVSDQIREYIINTTKYGGVPRAANDRTWSDDTEERVAAQEKLGITVEKHVLKALVFDFSAVSQTDSTGIQNLIDLRRDLNRFAGRPVAFHFANVPPHVRPQIEYFLEYSLKSDSALLSRPTHTVEQAPQGAVRGWALDNFFHVSVDEAVAAVEKIPIDNLLKDEEKGEKEKDDEDVIQI